MSATSPQNQNNEKKLKKSDKGLDVEIDVNKKNKEENNNNVDTQKLASNSGNNKTPKNAVAKPHSSSQPKSPSNQPGSSKKSAEPQDIPESETTKPRPSNQPEEPQDIPEESEADLARPSDPENESTEPRPSTPSEESSPENEVTKPQSSTPPENTSTTKKSSPENIPVSKEPTTPPTETPKTKPETETPKTKAERAQEYTKQQGEHLANIGEKGLGSAYNSYNNYKDKLQNYRDNLNPEQMKEAAKEKVKDKTKEKGQQAVQKGAENIAGEAGGAASKAGAETLKASKKITEKTDSKVLSFVLRWILYIAVSLFLFLIVGVGWIAFIIFFLPYVIYDSIKNKDYYAIPIMIIMLFLYIIAIISFFVIIYSYITDSWGYKALSFVNSTQNTVTGVASSINNFVIGSANSINNFVTGSSNNATGGGSASSVPSFVYDKNLESGGWKCSMLTSTEKNELKQYMYAEFRNRPAYAANCEGLRKLQDFENYSDDEWNDFVNFVHGFENCADLEVNRSSKFIDFKPDVLPMLHQDYALKFDQLAADIYCQNYNPDQKTSKLLLISESYRIPEVQAHYYEVTQRPEFKPCFNGQAAPKFRSMHELGGAIDVSDSSYNKNGYNQFVNTAQKYGFTPHSASRGFKQGKEWWHFDINALKSHKSNLENYYNDYIKCNVTTP